MPDDTDFPSRDRPQPDGPWFSPWSPVTPPTLPAQGVSPPGVTPPPGTNPPGFAPPPGFGASDRPPPGLWPADVPAPGYPAPPGDRLSPAEAQQTGAPPFGPAITPPDGPDGLFGAPGLPRRSRRSVLIAAAVALAVALLLATLVALLVESGPGPAPPAAQQVVHATEAATRSFHYVARFDSNGAIQTTVGDAGPTSGRQVITIGSQTSSVLVIGKACYFQGDANSMVDQLGVPPATAAAYAGQWISLAPTDPPYDEVYAAVTARSAMLDNIAFHPQRELPVSTVGGRRVITVTGPMTATTVNGQPQPAKGTAAFVVTASKPHRPLRYSERGTRGGQPTNFAMTFSRWNQPVHVSPPPASVSYSSLGAGTGGGGSGLPGGPVLT